MIESMIEANQFQQFERALSPLRDRAVGLEHRDLHVFGRGKGGQEVKGLKNKSNFVSTVGGRIWMIGKRLAAIEERPRRGPIQGSEHLQQG